MSEIVDAQIAEWCQYGDNPEGFPCCPKCGEFVALESDFKASGSTDYYFCGHCKIRFPLEEAI